MYTHRGGAGCRGTHIKHGLSTAVYDTVRARGSTTPASDRLVVPCGKYSCAAGLTITMAIKFGNIYEHLSIYAEPHPKAARHTRFYMG